jgi:hypothetical protein
VGEGISAMRSVKGSAPTPSDLLCGLFAGVLTREGRYDHNRDQSRRTRRQSHKG